MSVETPPQPRSPKSQCSTDPAALKLTGWGSSLDPGSGFQLDLCLGIQAVQSPGRSSCPLRPPLKLSTKNNPVAAEQTHNARGLQHWEQNTPIFAVVGLLVQPCPPSLLLWGLPQPLLPQGGCCSSCPIPLPGIAAPGSSTAPVLPRSPLPVKLSDALHLAQRTGTHTHTHIQDQTSQHIPPHTTCQSLPGCEHPLINKPQGKEKTKAMWDSLPPSLPGAHDLFLLTNNSS